MQFVPIGFIRTGKNVKFDTPHQPKDGVEEQNVIELSPKRDFDKALHDLEGFERIWLIWWFHKNENWKPKVLPPRGGKTRRGVFATRSPHRPNQIGITAVRLLKVAGRKLWVGNVDLLDGTPILDIKPYVPTVDAFPDSKVGWLSAVEAAAELPPKYAVEYDKLAEQQRAWLKAEWRIDFAETAEQVLARDPSPHRTRRITRPIDGVSRMGCGAWRLYFKVNESGIRIKRFAPGYPAKSLQTDRQNKIHDRAAQMAFYSIWPAE